MPILGTLLFISPGDQPMIEMYGIWCFAINGQLIPSWLSSATDFKGFRRGDKTLTTLSGEALNDFEYDREALSFWFSRSKANKYLVDARETCMSLGMGDNIGVEVRVVKVTPLIADYLRKRGWSFTTERDFDNA